MQIHKGPQGVDESAWDGRETFQLFQHAIEDSCADVLAVCHPLLRIVVMQTF
jgi:hypothetical protein